MKTYKTPEKYRERARVRAEEKRRMAGVPKRKTDEERWESFLRKDHRTGCILFMGSKSHSGHGRFGYKGSVIKAHRYAYTKKYGSIPLGKCVLHRCDTPNCVNPDHLFVGTQTDNMRDMVEKGRMVSGEDHYLSKLTRIQASKIKTDNRTTVTIGLEYGISPGTVWAIQNGKSWKDA